ncbi:hypothetical protein [Streptomyces albidoflavus]|uniref:hypothetical protein n=1 Tax=Streptomyces albidoflavus TaxID=1886 RepID=UPI00101E6FE7|nr:hypothetical protein [Streptomyces albidoflavus]RZD80615.1 hypothetical protein C0Q60_13140 [Streptomyces albidoflavus]RZD86638.1 hypothetical protein C0Q63_12515 [Streptomyces albidoflavus]RZD98186.1 hypothetical protein C0Q62_13025 [Streptomyces albidoflavus]RZE02518.1 hypothetical protein C0Q64_11665 [Streptomyces albidoflavus]RZE02915.1 hypothetical protein C0Q65_11995 [Streptomyces albidoflavus]
MRRLSRQGAVLGAGVVLLFAASTPAVADREESLVPSGGQENGNLNAQVEVIKYDTSKNGNGPSAGPVAAVQADWSPPPCWYAPKWTPDELRDYYQRGHEAIHHDPGMPPEAINEWSEERRNYIDGDYEDFNQEKEGEGMWWGAVQNPNAPFEEQFACDRVPFWADNGETPDVENIITPEILAGLAYEQIKVPGTEVTLAPGGKSKVNLPTWAWLDGGEFKPVAVTASLAVGGLDMSATTTATPKSLRIEPGTKDARLHPASGECTINGDGSIGEPYAKGKADQEPPCGVTYLRSSGDGSYAMEATVTWEISWTGTGVAAPQALPDGTFGNEQAVEVEEIQSINR